MARVTKNLFCGLIGEAVMKEDVNAAFGKPLNLGGADGSDATAKNPSRSVVLAKPDQSAVSTEHAAPSITKQSIPARRKWIWAVVVVAALGSAALLYFQPWVSKSLVVMTEAATPAPLTRVLAVNGRIAPLHMVDVKPTVGGAVTAVLAQEGDIVEAGVVLARVDQTQQQASVRQALAGLDAGLLSQSQAEAKYARAEALGGAIARTELEDAQTARQTAGQEVSRLTALFDQAQIELAKYTLHSPITGTILARQAEVGQVVDPATAVFTVADLGQLVVETDVDESYATQIVLGLPAVTLLKGATEKRNGSVSFVAPKVDAATGGLAIKIAFDTPVVVPVGLTVTANIIVDQKQAAISVPRAAVVTDAAGAAVYIAMAGKAVRHPVTVVDWPADRLEVTSGLVTGDVVIADATGLSDGLAIRIPAAAVSAP